jgi:beta-lactamase class A
LICFALTLTASAQTLDRRIHSAIDNFSGKVSLYAKNLDTGESYALRADDRVRTASTIKIAIMAAVFQAVADNRARWTDLLPVTDQGRVSGSGVVRELSTGVRLPIRDLVNLMIVVSDNTATNLLLERFTANAVNAEMDKLGLKQTRSLRMIRGDADDLKPPRGFSEAGHLPENEPFGIGVTTPHEMVMLLEKIEKGEVVSPAASRQMIAILKRQQYKDGIGRHTGNLPVANKTGSLDHLRSDVGIVYSAGGRIAIAITVDDMPAIDYSDDNPGTLLISRLTGILLQGLGSK